MSAGPSPSRRARLALPAWLTLGVAARVALAFDVRGLVSTSEADGFVRAWTGWQAGDLNRMRPAGWMALLDLLGGTLGLGSELGLRLACVGLSLAALGCGLLLVRVVARPERRATAGAWLVALWAVSPTLIEAGARPVAATATAGAVCLALAAAIAWQARPTLARWVFLCASLAVAVLVGGLPVAVAAVVAVLVELAALPPLRRSAPLVAATLLAAVGVWFVARPGADRPLLPEGCAAESLLVLTQAPPIAIVAQSVLPDRRISEAFGGALRAAQAEGWPACARRLGARFVADLLGPSRFDVPGRMLLAGLDILLLAVGAAGAWLALRTAPRRDEAGWPRAACVAGVLALLLATAATAADPWALAPVVLVLAALGATALAEGGRRRWLAGAAVGAVAVFGLALSLTPSGWTWLTPRDASEGPVLVDLLRDGGPRDLGGHLACTALLTDPAAPCLRLPEAAVRQAQAALVLAPDDQRVLLVAARAHAEALDLPGARALASSLVGDDGELVPEARTTLEALALIEKRLRSERLP